MGGRMDDFNFSQAHCYAMEMWQGNDSLQPNQIPNCNGRMFDLHNLAIKVATMRHCVL